MAMRAIWKGIIHFGSVRIPVKFYAAVQEVRVEFKLLHQEDNSPIKQEMVCSVEGIPVPADHQVKGVELAEGEYVVVEPGELASLEPEPGRDIEVRTFVTHSDLDERFLERPYYLAPDQDNRLYALFQQALVQTKRAGICRWTMRKRSYWGAVQAIDGMLVMTTLRNHEEVIPTSAFDVPPATLTEREQKLALYLIDELTGDFTPDQYQPVYYQRVQELVARKAAGEEVKVPEPVITPPTPEKELAKMLEASIEKVRKRAA
jgi:DNA end-binding protein Ku